MSSSENGHENFEMNVESTQHVTVNSSLDGTESHIRVSRYRKSSDTEISGVFSAPPGVNPFNVAATNVRKLTSGQFLIFF